MKPRIFIGSSTESIDISYAIQENLESYSEVTVWSQGIFELSKYTLDSLIDALDEFDFGVFVFSPDDLTIMRNQEKQVARDNVVFELGLFLGRLGKERSFIIIPRGYEDFHLPTDLAGITPATFEPDRQDENLNAALGPACNKIRKALEKFGPIQSLGKKSEKSLLEESDAFVEYDENDKKAILASWMGSRPASANVQVIR
jgi:predicted nucleotide-binding protein